MDFTETSLDSRNRLGAFDLSEVAGQTGQFVNRIYRFDGCSILLLRIYSK